MNKALLWTIDLLGICFLVAVGALVYAGSRPLPDPAWERVRQAGVLRVGMEPTYRPFAYIEAGELRGYDVELARRLGDELGVRAEFVSIALDGQYDALLAGQVDVLISAVPPIPERRHEVRYSQPYYNAGPLIVVPAGSTVATPADLAGKTVAVELGSSADMAARALRNSLSAPPLVDSSYHGAVEALAALVDGRADAAVSDPLGLADFVGARGGELRAVEPPLRDEFYVLAVKRDSRVLARLLDEALHSLRSSGELERIMSR